MAKQSTTTLKSYFETADRPSQVQFSDFIDSISNLEADSWEVNTLGTVNASAILQAIFDAAPNRTTIFLPKGTILLSSTVVISNEIKIVGQGTVMKTNTAIKNRCFIIKKT